MLPKKEMPIVSLKELYFESVERDMESGSNISSPATTI